MKLWQSAIALILVASSLTACNAISGIGTDNAPTPSPLVAITSEFPVQLVWNTRIGDGVEKDYLKLGPIVDGKLFNADPKGLVMATDVRNGMRVWHTNTKALITSGPVVGANLVLLGTSDGQVIALDETTGKQVWRVAIPDALLAAPQISGDKVLVKTVDGKLCALAIQDGHMLWLYDHGSPIQILRVNSAPQVVGNEVIAGYADGKLAAYNLQQGTILWEQAIALAQGATSAQQMVDVASDPMVANGVIFVGTFQGKIAAVSVASGQIIWQHDISTYTGLALGPKLLYVTDATGSVWAFNRTNGNVVWRQTQLGNRILTAPVIMGNNLVVADAQAYLHWLDQNDGHLVARVLVFKKKSITAPPAVLGNNVFVITTDGRLSAWKVGS